MERYWAVIGDIVRSRQAPDRSALQMRVEMLLGEINLRYGKALASAWTVTLGDEFQALFRQADELPLAIEAICHGLGGHGVRFGIGYGPLSTPRKPQAVGMDGPCFHRARSAVETARRRRKPVVVHLGDTVAERVTDVWSLALVLIGARTARQAQLIDLYRAEGTQSRVAALAGVTQGTVSSELTRAHFAEVNAVLVHVARMLGESAAEVET